MGEEQGDWRLSGNDHLQAQWLHGAVVRRTRYVESWERTDHAHCIFCCAKFMEDDYPDRPPMLHVGYKADDGPAWICEVCFRDFVDRFNWLIAESPDGLQSP
jgi:hypothetical protein